VTAGIILFCGSAVLPLHADILLPKSNFFYPRLEEKNTNSKPPIRKHVIGPHMNTDFQDAMKVKPSHGLQNS
jgi:hypothetical protein